MLKAAEALRRLDAGRFEPQIARIEECLRVDATWNLEAALASCRRTPARRPWGRGPAAALQARGSKTERQAGQIRPT